MREITHLPSQTIIFSSLSMSVQFVKVLKGESAKQVCQFPHFAVLFDVQTNRTFLLPILFFHILRGVKQLGKIQQVVHRH